MVRLRGKWLTLGNLIATFQYLRRGCQKDGARYITEACSRRIGHDNYKQRGDVLTAKKGKKKINMKIIKHWNRMPRVAMESPSSKNWKKT